jgi:glycosyltransferase involved in cell wall biosynthesis
MDDVCVSVVVPAHNAAPYLAEAIASIQAQAYGNLDIVVVDDGSTDATAEIAAVDGVRLRRQPQRGAGAARNAGLALARGELIAFLDADDLWTAGRLRSQLLAAASHPHVDLFFGQVEQFISPEIDASTAGLYCPPGRSPAYLVGCLLARASAFERVGGFREDLQVGEFVDWCARAEDLGLRSHMLDETVLRRRIHSTNLGLTQRAAAGDYAVVLKAALDRRRRMEPT